MARAKTIDRLEYTKRRFGLLNEDFRGSADSEYTRVNAGLMRQETPEPETESQGSGFIICPVCGEKLIHESGCLRCVCGWSKY